MNHGWIVVSLALALGGLREASAAVYKCDVAERGDSFLLVLNSKTGKAAVFGGSKEQRGYGDWELLFGEATLAIAMDGGPVTVVGKDESETDWSQEQDCYRWKTPTHQFTLRGSKGILRVLPAVDVMPNAAGCAVPRPMVPRPQELACSLF